MTDLRTTELAIVTDGMDGAANSAVSWAAVAAGAFAAAALTLLLMAFGAGTGLSAVSPWSNAGVSSTTFSVVAGIYLVVAAVLASTIGGYVAGRLRTRWVGVHTDEVYFRDTAHGFLAWAVATVLSAAVLGAAMTAIVSGATAGLSQRNAPAGGPADIYVDQLFRPNPGSAQGGVSAPGGTAAGLVAPAQGSADQAVRAEVSRIFLRSFRDRSDITAADRSYMAQLVEARTGMSSGRCRQEGLRRHRAGEVGSRQGAQCGRETGALADGGPSGRGVCGQPCGDRGRSTARSPDLPVNP